MCLEEVTPEVSLRIPPNRMDVIGCILGTVVLDDHGRTVKAVVVRSPGTLRSRPGKVDAIEIRCFETIAFDIRQRNRKPVYVETDQVFEQLPLVRTHRRRRQTCGPGQIKPQGFAVSGSH